VRCSPSRVRAGPPPPAQVRSTAIDLVRAAETGRSAAAPPAETPTEELLIQLPAPA
jgi:hypothetical protein